LSLFNDNKYDEAILILRNLISLHPLYFDALILIAKILIHDKDYNAAEKLLIFITKYDKSNPEVNFLLEAIKKIEN
jgi:tetratricopeptide (TPR) repeat protein